MHKCSLKTSVYFGDNALTRLSQIKYKNVFIIADPFTVSSGLITNITRQLDTAGIKYEIYSNVVPDPSIEKVVEGVTALMKNKAPCLIAVGGGSAIDLSKCVRQFANKIENDYFPYFIAVPTTSGTGSEVTSFAVITDTENHVKHALVDDSLLPEEAILDVDMVRSVPASITADTGMDVMTHAIEAYVSINANDTSDMYCEKATAHCKRYLVRSYKFPETGEVRAREKMHLASNLAGIAFNAVSLGLNHGMAHQLGAQFHIPHGRANAILLPFVIEYNSGISGSSQYASSKPTVVHDCAAKYAKLARKLGIGNPNNDVESVRNLLKLIRTMQKEMNMPTTIREACPKLTREEYMKHVDAMTAAALKDRCTPTNPRVPQAAEIKKVFENIW